MFWKVLGKRYGDAGLIDLFIELKVFGPNAAKVIMTGKNCKRYSLGHKLMHEVMSPMQWAAFLEWTVSKEVNVQKRSIKKVLSRQQKCPKKLVSRQWKEGKKSMSRIITLYTHTASEAQHAITNGHCHLQLGGAVSPSAGPGPW